MDSKRKLRKKQKNNSKIYSTVLSLVIFILVVFVLVNKENTLNIAVSNKETVYPTLYSNREITENAKKTLSKFKNIAFEKRDVKENLANLISSTPQKKTVSNEKETGVWLWTPIEYITDKYADEIIKETKDRGIKNIYLSIDSYLDIFVMQESKEKELKRQKFDETVENFIKKAKASGMTVDAEAGWKNWGVKGNTYKAVATLSYVMNFNKNHEYKFRGFQYDVEPYLLDEYKKNKTKVLKEFLDLIKGSVYVLKDSPLEFSVVIPEFYDGSNEETPKFSYSGKKAYTIEHLLRILENKPQSKIIVMSYRNWSDGDNGSIDISKDEILKANQYTSKIVLAQETGDVLPPYITFHNTRFSYYKKQLNLLIKEFDKEKSFGGVATHYANALISLK